MVKDETSRSDELLALGWPPEDVRRYAELWEYRQRWGAINLEREDRIFLRRADAALPRRLTGKAAQKKSLRDKSHVRWLTLHRDAMRAAAADQGLADAEQGAWEVLLNEELALLDHYQPVLGLPDTLKAKELLPIREQLIQQAASGATVLAFDFVEPLEALKRQETTSWKPLRGEGNTDTSYPVLAADAVEAFRQDAASRIGAALRALFPSLKESDKAPFGA